MSIRLLILFLVTLSSVSTQAQVIKSLLRFDEYEVALGTNLLLNHNIDPSIDPRWKLGFTGSMSFLRKVRPNLFFASRLFYDYKGDIGKYKTQYWDVDKWKNGEVESETYLSYFGVGLMPRFMVGSTGLYFEAGLFATYFIKGSSISRHSWDNVQYKYEIERDPKFLGGGSFTIGYHVAINQRIGLNFLLIENLNVLDYVNSTVSFQTGLFFKK